jgi:acetate kinase
MSEAVRAFFLVLNAGSSSLKFGLYAADDLAALCRGGVDAIGPRATWSVKGTLANRFDRAPPLPKDESQATVVDWLLHALHTCLPHYKVVAAGHRVVHGGRRFDRPVIIDDSIMAALADLVALAPAHQPHNLAAIRAVAAAWPGLPQAACFDTAFHFGQPWLARLFGLPRSLSEEGMVRYGFHGLSYEYIAGCMSDAAGIRPGQSVVVAHLGHGASLCAMRNGRSVATTMGFTTMDGLVMGKRCGTLDPGVVLYLMREKRLSVAEVDEILNERSGLLGVSGLSDDLRDLEASDKAEAAEALELFAYRAARELGSLAAALGGLDALVYTAGIGEHSASIRARICRLSAWTGLILDEDANAAHRTRISTPSSRVAAFVIPTDEEIVIARAMRKLRL